MSTKPGIDQPREARRDPDDLQREADAIRADLDRTLGALERKFSPKQLLDRSLSFMHENGGDILQKIGANVSKHPLPLLLTSAGLVWLIAANRSSRSTNRFDSPSTSPRHGDFDPESQSFEAGSTRTRRAANRLKARASQTFDRTRERTVDLGRSLNDVVQEQPLVCGAIALAVGAVVGAAIPATEYERDLIARARANSGSLLNDLKSEAEGLQAAATSAPTPTSH